MTTRKPPKGQNQTFLSGPRKSANPRPKRGRKEGGKPVIDNWLYGDHAVMAALANPKRVINRLVLTKSKFEHLSDSELALVKAFPNAEVIQPDQLHDLVPENAIHQGIAILPQNLPGLHLEDLLQIIGEDEKANVVVLDQVTDPHNVGAILRSAAAFEISALIVPDRHTPPISGVLARAASGAVEQVPVIRVSNLARALEKLTEFGFWRIGLDGTANQELEEAVANSGRLALVLGSEGKGLRRLTAENCDLLAKLPISEKMESLNVSNAAAIAFYELSRRNRT
ncbi:MAG: 23S rRNA (guanosine(2251)-2'-O)-methyltransferase RlmB [Sneathiella sp.]